MVHVTLSTKPIYPPPSSALSYALCSCFFSLHCCLSCFTKPPKSNRRFDSCFTIIVLYGQMGLSNLQSFSTLFTMFSQEGSLKHVNFLHPLSGGGGHVVVSDWQERST